MCNAHFQMRMHHTLPEILNDLYQVVHKLINNSSLNKGNRGPHSLDKVVFSSATKRIKKPEIKPKPIVYLL